MTGERWEWFRVAAHLRTTVGELQSRIGYSEFVDWLVFLQKEEVERNALHEAYLMQIAAEVRRGWVSKPEKVHVKDFVLEFRAADSPSPIPPVDLKEKIAKSKKAWLEATGAKPKKKK